MCNNALWVNAEIHIAFVAKGHLSQMLTVILHFTLSLHNEDWMKAHLNMLSSNSFTHKLFLGIQLVLQFQKRQASLCHRSMDSFVKDSQNSALVSFQGVHMQHCLWREATALLAS